MTEWGIDTLFNPGKRHLDEEKRRLQSTREEVGDASGGRRVDFTAGTVRISRSGTEESDPATENEANEAVSEDEAASQDKAEADPVAEDRQRRARERRARMAGGAAKVEDTAEKDPNPAPDQPHDPNRGDTTNPDEGGRSKPRG